MKVIVTGSSNGIGKAIALKFLENNHEVIGIDIDKLYLMITILIYKTVFYLTNYLIFLMLIF